MKNKPEPVFGIAIPKERIWGGQRLSVFVPQLPVVQFGEAWETFPGYDVSTGKEPDLLVKLIDAKENLSIQVHPDDKYAREIEGAPCGKTEIWYVLDCSESAYLYAGLKHGVTKEEFRRAAEAGGTELTELLTEVPVSPGSIVPIPAGCPHAITAGMLVLEIQQNCDITYRVFDYGRMENGKPRELHLDKAIECIFDINPITPVVTDSLMDMGFFTAEKISIRDRIIITSNDYVLLSSLSKTCMVEGKPLPVGRTALLPAGGRYEITGLGQILVSEPKTLTK